MMSASFSVLKAAEDKRELTDYDYKVIEQFKKYGHMSGGVGYPENHQYWKDLKWFHDQGDKVRPGLMYLLEHEYKGQWNQMRDVMSGLGNRRDEDQSDLVEHVRRNLPQFVDKVKNDNRGYVYKSLRYLSEYGDASDIPLMEKFAEIGGEIERLHTRQDIRKLKDRLTREKELKEMDTKKKRDYEVSDEARKRGPTKSQEKPSVEKKESAYQWMYILATVVFSLAAFWYLKRIQTRS